MSLTKKTRRDQEKPRESRIISALQDWPSVRNAFLSITHYVVSLIVLVFIIYVGYQVFHFIFSKTPDIIISSAEWDEKNQLKITARALDKGEPIEEGVIEFVLTQKREVGGREILHQTYRSALLHTSAAQDTKTREPTEEIGVTGNAPLSVEVTFAEAIKDNVLSVRGNLYMPDKRGPAAERDFHFEKQRLVMIKGRSVFFWLATLVSVLLLITVLTFTGDLTRGKLHALMILMYLMTFLSIVAPSSIALLLHYSEDLPLQMQKSIIGLVLGKTSEDADPQWLLNIGGIVNSTAKQGLDTPSGIRQSYPLVIGGVVVPFYVIWLAMVGAGINMTRRVPDFQRTYAETLPSSPGNDEKEAVFKRFMRALDPFSGEFVENEKEAAIIRGHLIRNYMYLLSAPFLGITVYYLLQVLGTKVTFPAMVVVAFFTGLKSDTIVKAIARVGESIINIEKIEEDEQQLRQEEKKLQKREEQLKEREKALNAEAAQKGEK